MELTAVLAWLTVLVAVPLCAVASWLLLRMSREAPHLRVLSERFKVALVTTFVVLLFGLIFINNDQTVPPISFDDTKLITRTSILILSLTVGGGWIWIYWSTRKKRKE